MTFQELLNSRAHDYDCSIVIGDVDYVSDKCYRTWFSEYGECAPTECSKCDRKDCFHREAFRRLLKCDGGLELCPLFDE